VAKFEQHTNIAAPVEAVWSILSNPQQWPFWFPDVQAVTNLSTVETGATFQWQNGDHNGTGAIVRANPNERLEVLIEGGGHNTHHTLQVEHHGGVLGIGGHDSRLTYILEIHPPGGFIGEFIEGGNPMDIRKAQHVVAQVKELAEGAAGH
jgi:uncharacterized protein YndB with AHSA1/START domain